MYIQLDNPISSEGNEGGGGTFLKVNVFTLTFSFFSLSHAVLFYAFYVRSIYSEENSENLDRAELNFNSVKLHHITSLTFSTFATN